MWGPILLADHSLAPACLVSVRDRVCGSPRLFLPETISGDPYAPFTPTWCTLAWLVLALREVNGQVPEMDAGDGETDTEQRDHEPSRHRLCFLSIYCVSGTRLRHVTRTAVLPQDSGSDQPSIPPPPPSPHPKPSHRPVQPAAFSTPVLGTGQQLQRFRVGEAWHPPPGLRCQPQVPLVSPSSPLPFPWSAPLPDPQGLFQISAPLKVCFQPQARH